MCRIVGLLVVVFCYCTSHAAVKLSKQQILRVGNTSEPRDLDPAILTGVPGSHIVDNLFEGLTSYDPYTLEPRPGVAETWKISSDGKTYTFYLRDDARWSDGRKLTAEDFAWAWQRALNPATASEYAYQLYYLKNGEALAQGKLKDFGKLGVEVLDKDPTKKDRLVLKVTLEHPTPFFLRLTSFHTLHPTPKHTIEKYGDRWTTEGKMVSNGPFKLSEWKLNRHIKIVKNDAYWDKNKVGIEAVYFYPIENSVTEEKTYKAGDLHLTSTIPLIRIPYYMKQLSNRAPGQYIDYKHSPSLSVYFYRFNTTKVPLNDVRVRRALAMTVDRKLLVEGVLRGGQQPATSFTPYVDGYKFSNKGLPTTVTPEVVAEAKELLRKAGYPNGEGMPKFEILYNTLEANKKIAIAIQRMWKEHLGIEVGIFNQEWKVFLDTQHNMNYSIARAGWLGDYPDPNTFLDMFVTGGGNNETGWSNPQYDKLIDMAAETTDRQKRFQHFRTAEAILMEELPIIPIYFSTNQRLVSQKVKMRDNGHLRDWQPNIMDRLLFKYYALIDINNGG